MSTLNVTRALVTQTNPTEAQFDTMRTYLLNFFNSGNLDEDNVAASSMVYTKLGHLADDGALKFENADGFLKYDSSNDFFDISNTEGDIVFGVYSGSLTNTMHLRESDGALVLATGLVEINQSVGSQNASLLWLLSKYHKPRLTYTSSDIITVADNTETAGSPIVMIQGQLYDIYDTSMSLAVTANGYDADHTSTAASGILSGESRTANRWYYIYAVEVQGGTQADGAKAILVATTTSPETTNITTHDTNFGAGKWVYMGVIRNGYNDGTNTNVVVPFDYDEGGFFSFRDTTVSAEGKGLTLASSSDADDLEYAVSIGNGSAATIPPVASRIIVGGHREQDGFELHYRVVATDENHAITGGCYHNGTIAALNPCVYMEVPLLSSYKFVIVGGTLSTDKRIVLSGLMDHYV